MCKIAITLSQPSSYPRAACSEINNRVGVDQAMFAVSIVSATCHHTISVGDKASANKHGFIGFIDRHTAWVQTFRRGSRLWVEGEI